LLLAVTSPVSRAGTAEEACKTMTGKLAAQAKLAYWRIGFNDGWDHRIHQGSMMKNAEFVVSTAYLMDEKSMNKKWPGFWAWSVAEVLKAWRDSWTVDELETRGFLDCLARYSQ
jgi:hypothetical protein